MILRRSAEVVALLALVVAATGVQTQPHEADTSQAEATVTVYGRPGSFGALTQTVPSGQELAKAGVPGWAFPAGRQPHRVVKAGNTLLLAARDLGNWEHPSSGDLFAGAFDLTTKRLSIIRIPTTASKRSVWRDGHATAPSISDIVVLDDNTAVYTAWPTQLFQDLAKDGTWPVLGLLIKVDGQWKAGPSWTGGSLRAAGWEKACPQEQVPEYVTVAANPNQSDCRGLGRMTRLRSGDIVVTQKTGFLIVRVAREGFVDLKAQYDFPAGAGSPWEVTAHPIEDRFVVGLRFGSGPPTVQEFKWDKESASIAALSGRLLPGDSGKGYGAATYDAFGNLWLSRWDGDVTGGALAVFARQRCAPAVQAVVCRPDYDISQAKYYGAAQALMLDPVTNTVIYLARFGVMQAMRFNGETFTISNPVDFGSRLLLGREGAYVEHRAGAVIGNRVWLTGLQHQPGTVAAPFDQWLYSVNLSDLFTPAAHLLPSDPSFSATIQIAQTAETGTTQERLPTGVTNVISKAGFGFCSDSPAGSACATDQVPGNGFYLRDDNTGYGVLHGTITYQIKVLEPGSYRLTARVFAFPVTKNAVVEDRKSVV